MIIKNNFKIPFLFSREREIWIYKEDLNTNFDGLNTNDVKDLAKECIGFNKKLIVKGHGVNGTDVLTEKDLNELIKESNPLSDTDQAK